MRNVFVVAYDICDPRRWRKVYRLMCGVGDSLQYSVFRCELTAVELQQLKSELWPLLNLGQDRVMLLDLGPAGGRGDQCVEFWGEPRSFRDFRTANIF